MLTAGLWWLPVLVLLGPLLGVLAFAVRHWRDILRMVLRRLGQRIDTARLIATFQGRRKALAYFLDGSPTPWD